MSINLNDNLIVQAPKATDERYGPYTSTAQALAAINPIVRYQGLTIGVEAGGSVTEYWFKDGISDFDLVVKSEVVTTIPLDIGFACGDETTNLSTGLKFTFRLPFNTLLYGVKLGVNTAPAGSDLVVDIKYKWLGAENSIFSTKPSISDGSKVGGNGAILIGTPYYLPFAYQLTTYIDQVGSTVPGTGLKVWLLGVKGGGE
jgi:hypothetical protein